MPPDSLAAAVRLRRFLAFATGQTVSQFGDKLDQMALVAILGTLGSTSRAAWSLAELAVVVALPVILFGPVAGVLVDRWDRRTTLVAGDVVRALLVASIPAAHRAAGSVWPIYVIVFLVFLVTLVSNAAKMAVIPNLVATHQLLPANALITFVGRVATIAGIVLGGLVIDWGLWSGFGWTGYEAAFYLDGVSFAFSALMLAVALPRCRPPEKVPTRRSTAWRRLMPEVRNMSGRVARDFGDAVRLIRSDRRLGFVFVTIALMAAASGAAFVLTVVVVQTILRFGTSGLGLIGGIGAGGTVLGSLLAGTALRRWPRQRTITAGLLALGLLVLVFAESTTFVGVALVAFLIGLSLAPIVISQDTWLHELLPERMRGRGFAIRELLNNAVGALASVLAAAGVLVASVLGSAEPYRLTLYALGGALIAATLLVGRLAVQHRLATSQPAAARPSVMAGESEVPASVPERGAVPRAHPGNPVARSSDGLL